jgi:Protein of unknown function (DUF3768)
MTRRAPPADAAPLTAAELAALLFAVREAAAERPEAPGAGDTTPPPAPHRNHIATRGERTMDPRTARIRALNDRLRTAGLGGDVVLSGGVAALPGPVLVAVMAAVQAFDRFSPDNDPFGEHDCAALEVDGRRVLFKIDYHDAGLRGGSPDPADPGATRRVLTIMLAEEY